MTDAGYSITEGVLSAGECESLTTAIRGAAGRAGARNLMANAAVLSIANDARMLRLAKQTLGDDAFPFRATLFDKSADVNWHVLWHQDRALPLKNRVDCTDWGPWSTKCGVLYALAPVSALESVVALRIHLDAATKTNGPLRVIPGSHMIGIMDAAQISATVRDVSANDCVVGCGGVVAMRPLLLHSSPKATGNARRRVLHIEYADRVDFGNGLRLSIS